MYIHQFLKSCLSIFLKNSVTNSIIIGRHPNSLTIGTPNSFIIGLPKFLHYRTTILPHYRVIDFPIGEDFNPWITLVVYFGQFLLFTLDVNFSHKNDVL